jgi:hypothetical protein
MTTWKLPISAAAAQRASYLPFYVTIDEDHGIPGECENVDVSIILP